MVLTRIEARKLKKHLPTGWANKIADGRGCTPAFVRMVLTGEREHEGILDEIIALAAKEKVKKEKNRKKITEL